MKAKQPFNRLPTFLCLAAAIFFAVCTTAPASMLSALSPAELTQLKAGETVVQSKDIAGKAWPELTLFRIVNAKPQVVADLFTDYASAPSYTPGMIAAEVIGEPAPDVKDVRYTVKVPVLSKISYTVRNKFTKTNGNFEVTWNLLESPLASESTGSLLIEPYEGKTVLRYRNHVTPSIPMAGALQSQARKEAETTIAAIAKEAEKRAGKN